MALEDRISELAAPVCAAAEVELVDVELNGGVLRITVARDGGLDLDVISRLTRQISRLLDDTDPIPGRYTLEVSSPGLERRLRTPAHFARAVGETVALRTVAGTEAGRRLRGVVLAADADSITLEVEGRDDPVTVGLAQIERARTVFEWGPTPKPGGPRPTTSPKSPAQKAAKP